MYDYTRDFRTLHQSAAVDWVTMTVKDVNDREKVLRRYQRIKLAMLELGELPRPWGMKSYRGFSIGHMRWGTRTDSDIIILSGIDAQAFWTLFAPLCSNCSRLDLAVTCRIDSPMPGLLEMYKREARAIGRVPSRRYPHIENGTGGQTLYVGSRSSDQFGRVYDKAREQGDARWFDRCWRYEVQYQDTLAKLALKSIIDLPSSTELAGRINALVYTWFQTRDIPPLFELKGGAQVLERSAVVVTSSKQLAWLTTQVRPTVQQLLQGGFEDEVLQALGIPHP